MKNALIIIVGISTVSNQAYGEVDINSNKKILAHLQSKYDKICYIKYQDILDKNAFIGKKFLDPVRLKFKRKEVKEILSLITNKILSLQSAGYTVDVLAHSLGCWIMSKVPVNVNKLMMTGSPVGFKAQVARFIVRNDICFWVWSKPPLKCKTFVNLFSTNILEPVGTRPNIPDNKKWAYGAERAIEANTYKSHDFKHYIKYAFGWGLL